MNLKQLEYFVKLAETEHYRKAAEELYITEPSLNRSIRELEKEIGIPLFDKRGRNIYLNKYGHIFLPYIQRSLQEIAKGTEILKAFTRPDQGTVTLGFIYTMGYTLVPDMIQRFKHDGGNRDVSFDFVQGTTNTLLQRLRDDKIDIAFCSSVPDDRDILFYPLVEEELVLAVPEDHPLAARETVSLRDIGDYPFIAFNAQSGLGIWIRALFEKAGMEPNVVCHMEEDNAMAGLVSTGYGIAILPDFYTLKYYRVKRLRITDALDKRYIYMAMRKQANVLPVVDRFRQFVLREWQRSI